MYSLRNMNNVVIYKTLRVSMSSFESLSINHKPFTITNPLPSQWILESPDRI
jgi:hypothetical protein